MLMAVKCNGRAARALRIRCPGARSANDNVPQKLGVTFGTSGIVSSEVEWGKRYAISRSWTFGRRERKSKRVAGSSVQNRRLNARNELPK